MAFTDISSQLRRFSGDSSQTLLEFNCLSNAKLKCIEKIAKGYGRLRCESHSQGFGFGMEQTLYIFKEDTLSFEVKSSQPMFSIPEHLPKSQGSSAAAAAAESPEEELEASNSSSPLTLQNVELQNRCFNNCEIDEARVFSGGPAASAEIMSRAELLKGSEDCNASGSMTEGSTVLDSETASLSSVDSESPIYDEIEVGEMVCLRGFSSHERLNGQAAVVAAYSEISACYQVLVSSSLGCVTIEAGREQLTCM